MSVYDIIIIGSGPAGLTAAIYAARAHRKVLVLAGDAPGGQLMLTTDVEDFPGFKKIQGPELMEKMIEHARSFGIDFVTKNVTRVLTSQQPFTVDAGKTSYQAQSIIVATGASAKWLGLESEKKLIGKGVSACAVCDAPFFQGMDVAVVGGGDTALREALHLAKICKSVTLIHRRDELRAQKELQARAFATKNISFLWHHEVERFAGEEKLEALELVDTKEKKKKSLPFQGCFVAIGHSPNTSFLKGEVRLDDHNYIEVKNHVFSSVEGVFAAGDVHDYSYMQAVTAAGAGCMAALEADHYLDRVKKN